MSGTGLRRRLGPVPRWGLLLWAGALLLFGTGLLQALACRHGHCPVPAAAGRFLSADALGSLPRLFTTSVFVALTVLAATGVARSADRARLWWVALTAIGAGLAVAKLTSEHSALERDDGRTATLAVATAAVVLGGLLLRRFGRRWSVPGADAVVTALFGYALAALGMDQVTGLVQRSGHAGLAVVATYAEETGEALTAVLLLVLAARARDRLPGVHSERQQ